MAGGFDLEFVDQHVFDVQILAPRRPGGELHFFGRQHGIGNQVIVFAAQHRRRAAALAQGDLQSLAQVRRTFFGNGRKGLAALGVDDLHDANQFVGSAVYDRRHQHLLGAVAGSLVDLLEETSDWGCALRSSLSS